MMQLRTFYKWDDIRKVFRLMLFDVMQLTMKNAIDQNTSASKKAFNTVKTPATFVFT